MAQTNMASEGFLRRLRDVVPLVAARGRHEEAVSVKFDERAFRRAIERCRRVLSLGRPLKLTQGHVGPPLQVTCEQCTNAHRDMKSDGTTPDAVPPRDAPDARSPREILQAEGVTFTGDRADPERGLDSDALVALVLE